MASLWFVLGLIALLLVLIYLSVRERNMATVRVEAGEVVIEPRGLNKLWTMRSEVTVPLSAVTDARVVSGFDQLPSRGIRIPGTSAPGLIVAGSYWKPGQRSFYAVHDAKDMVVVKTEGQRYDIIAVQTLDPYGAINQINAGRTEPPTLEAGRTGTST